MTLYAVLLYQKCRYYLEMQTASTYVNTNSNVLPLISKAMCDELGSNSITLGSLRKAESLA